MANKSLAFKIFFSIGILVSLLLFSCIYSILMINKTQVYAQDVATNWLPSIDSFGKVNLYIGNLSRRTVLVIADSVANQSERLEKNTEDLKKFKDQLDNELTNYQKNGLLGPGEEPFYKEPWTLIKNTSKAMSKNLV